MLDFGIFLLLMKLASLILEFVKQKTKNNLCIYFAHPWKIQFLFNIALKVLVNEINQEKKEIKMCNYWKGRNKAVLLAKHTVTYIENMQYNIR